MTEKARVDAMDETDAKNGMRADALETDVTPRDDEEEEQTAIEAVPEGSGVEAREGKGEEAPPPAAELPPEEALARAQEQLQALKAERDRLYDAWLRTSADFENFRKRMVRERDEYRHYAIENLLLGLLPVLDNFERALSSLPPGLQRGFVEGVNLIYKQLGDLLAKHGVTPISTEGEMFDPHLHEAVETESRNDVPHHRILCERQKGYRLGGRIIRPAKVKVSVRADEGASNAQIEPAEGSN